jgi:hypothetical protein
LAVNDRARITKTIPGVDVSVDPREEIGGYLEADLDRGAAAHRLQLRPAWPTRSATRSVSPAVAQRPREQPSGATGYRPDHSWIEAPKGDSVTAIGRHGRTPLPQLWFVRGRFLFPISQDARDVARDVGRRG